MKKKLSLTEKISLAENNAVDFMHACVTIALHDEYEVGVQRLRKVNLRRDEINEEMLEVMVQPRKSGREQAAAGQAWLVSLLPEGAETEFRVPLGKGAARKQKELRISGARMQQLAAALDGGVLITEDGAEFELYGNRGNA